MTYFRLMLNLAGRDQPRHFLELVTSHCFLHDFWTLLFQESSKTVISRKPPTAAASSSYVYFSSLPACPLSIQFPPGSWTFTIVIQVRGPLDLSDLCSSGLHQDNFSPQSSAFNLRTVSRSSSDHFSLPRLNCFLLSPDATEQNH
ncbi:hypothetical protein CRENBAI_026061 [Crenichthys baileyi]|uniref:Uncharacterized protein n=1 Tax=Crenichthys baileyi TaxID=28760 RepID=A0AAV9R8M1_9TELE